MWQQNLDLLGLKWCNIISKRDFMGWSKYQTCGDFIEGIPQVGSVCCHILSWGSTRPTEGFGTEQAKFGNGFKAILYLFWMNHIPAILGCALWFPRKLDILLGYTPKPNLCPTEYPHVLSVSLSKSQGVSNSGQSRPVSDDGKDSIWYVVFIQLYLHNVLYAIYYIL